MSVLKNKRGLSKMEFYHNARRMRGDITLLLLRDFGIHGRKSIGTGGHPEGYYDELISEFTLNMRVIMRNMMLNITAGNTIFPASEDELTLRRRYQTGAIINCEQLLQEAQYAMDVLPVKASMFALFISQIEYEIALLKGWRKANNKIGGHIRNNSLCKEETEE